MYTCNEIYMMYTCHEIYIYDTVMYMSLIFWNQERRLAVAARPAATFEVFEASKLRLDTRLFGRYQSTCRRCVAQEIVRSPDFQVMSPNV